jgi:tetratricopeptide (TPR) repeat protein
VTTAGVARGNSLALAGHFAEGQAQLEYALNALEQAAIPDPLNRACLMNAIGFLERRQGRPAFAVEWFRRALEVKPPSDALLVLLTGNLASAYAESSHLDQAEEAARRALQIAVRAFGPDHPETLFPATTLAFIYAARGNYEAAEPVLRRVLAQAERSWGASSYEVANAAGNLGLILFTNRRYALARELLLKSLAGLEQTPIKAKDQVPLTQALVAGSYAAEGRRRPAEIWLERALRNAQQELSPEDPSLPVVLERAAAARFCLKDTDAGAELFDRSVALLESQHDSRSQPVLDALERYAALLRLAKDKRRVKVIEARREALARK